MRLRRPTAPAPEPPPPPRHLCVWHREKPARARFSRPRSFSDSARSTGVAFPPIFRGSGLFRKTGRNSGIPRTTRHGLSIVNRDSQALDSANSVRRDFRGWAHVPWSTSLRIVIEFSRRLRRIIKGESGVGFSLENVLFREEAGNVCK